MKKFICCVLILILILPFLPSAEALSMVENATAILETKVYSNATLENDFADNRVMVVLSNQESLRFKTYGLSDFSEIDCKSVVDLTSPIKDQVQSALQTQSQLYTATNKTDHVEIDTTSYHQIICVELENAGKKNVLAAIKSLSQRTDVVYAGPDYTVTLAAMAPNDDYYSEQWGYEKFSCHRLGRILRGLPASRLGLLTQELMANILTWHLR